MKRETYTKYIAGFILSIVLTLAAFFAVTDPAWFHFAPGMVLAAILMLAIIQLVVQLFCFLDLSFRSRDRWRMVAFVSAIGLVLIIVIGSIWIMGHLNYNMTPSQINQYMNDQQGGF